MQISPRTQMLEVPHHILRYMFLGINYVWTMMVLEARLAAFGYIATW